MDDLKEPFCATCGCSVPEVLCTRCTKWWAENTQAGDAGELLKLLEERAAGYGDLRQSSLTSIALDRAATTIRTLQARLDVVREDAVLSAYQRGYRDGHEDGRTGLPYHRDTESEGFAQWQADNPAYLMEQSQ